MRRISILALLIFLGLNLLTSGCSLTPVGPVPTDHYYRLPDPTNLEPRQIFDKGVFVRSFRSDGLHLERAVLFSKDEQALVLEQHHYHFWQDSPQRMLQNHMVAWLRAAEVAPLVVSDPAVKHQYVITTQIKRFERHIAGSRSNALVALEIQLQRRGSREVLLVRDYSAEVSAENRKVASSIPAFAEALDDIFNRFVDEAAQIQRQAPNPTQ